MRDNASYVSLHAVAVIVETCRHKVAYVADKPREYAGLDKVS